MRLKYSLEFMKLSKELVSMDVPRNLKVMCGVLSEVLDIPKDAMLFSALLEFFSHRMSAMNMSDREKNYLMITVFDAISDGVVNGEDK